MKLEFENIKLLKAGFRIIELINENIEKGVDIEDQPFAKYSPKYRIWKEKRYPQDRGKVNLTAKGTMLQALNTVKAMDNEITIGFDDEEQARIAYYHNISGAGRGRVIRKFLGLREEQYSDNKLLRLLGDALIVTGFD